MSDPASNGHGLELETLGAAPAAGTTGPKMLVPLFLVPLLIVAVIVAIFIGVGSVVGTEKTVEEWIAEVETGGVNERWQAAANLTDVALKHPETLATPEIRRRLRDLFTVAGPEDTRIRQWVAEIWSAVGDAESAPMIVDGIARMKEVLETPEGRSGPSAEPALRELINYVRALARVGKSTDVAAVLSVATDPDLGVRMAVAEALGFMARKSISEGGAPSPELVEALVRLHGDADVWVRMNAALSLAKGGRLEGMPTLETMLDRAWLKSQGLSFPDDGHYSVAQFDPAVSPIVSALVAIEALWSLSPIEGANLNSLRAAVATALNDPNPQVQQRAKELLKKVGG